MDLSDNNITYLPEHLFEFTPNVKHLNISYNFLEDIEKNVLDNLLNLRSLDLSYNKLFTDNFLQSASIMKLEYLNLSSNEYRTLNVSILSGLNLIDVILYDNPWDCKWLVNQLSTKQQKKFHFGNDYEIDKIGDMLNVKGITCEDDFGDIRNIILMESTKKILVEEELVEIITEVSVYRIDKRKLSGLNLFGFFDFEFWITCLYFFYSIKFSIEIFITRVVYCFQ